jgi:hypothetical protein
MSTETRTAANHDTVIASVYYVGPEWVLAMSDPERPGRLRYIPELGSINSWRNRDEAEAEAIRLATARGASSVEFHDIDGFHAQPDLPYKTVKL